MGLFGGSGDDGIERVAELVDADANATAVAREVEDLVDAVETVADAADLETHAFSQPGESPAERAQALAREIERGRLDVEPSGGASGPGGGRESSDEGAAAAARRLDDQLSPRDETAASLLSAVAGDDEREARRALRDAVDGLEERRAVADVPADASADEVRRALRGADGDVAERVRRLADRVARAEERVEGTDDERRRLADAVDAVGAMAAKETGADVGPGSASSTVERAERLVDAVESGQLSFGDAESDVEVVAATVRESATPESGTANRLLDNLAQPGRRGQLADALEAAVTELDEAAAATDVTSRVDRDAVMALSERVAASLDGESGPVADALERRVEDLADMLERAGDANAVVPYAVRQELRFYDNTLVDALSRRDRPSPPSGDDADVSGLLGDVSERRDDVEEQYVEGRSDHNHSIPLHFLGLVDALVAEARKQQSSGDGERAAGTLAAADAVLDHVEQLYERTEYRVMLRRLRG